MAAVEFAVILPLLLLLYIGAFEVGDAVSISRKVTITSRTITDLATQYVTMTESDVKSVLGTSARVIAPYNSDPLVVTLTEISTDASGISQVMWSRSTGAGFLAAGSSPSLPPGVTRPNASLIWGHVTYGFVPPIGYALTKTILLSSDIYMSPRQSSTIPISGP